MTVYARGRVTTWKDEEGYGFIKPDQGGEDVFFHVSAVRGRRRPWTGARLRFRARRERDRLRAEEVRLSAFAPARITLVTAALVAGAAGAVALRAGGWVAVPWPVLVYAVMSLVTFLGYAVDKQRARTQGRRIPEATLHGLELVGGWPGALVAQSFFRHKRRKLSYLVVFWLIVALHVGFWIWYFQAGHDFLTR